MPGYLYNPDRARWGGVDFLAHSGDAWKDTAQAKAYAGVHWGGMGYPYLGEGTVWQRDVSRMPVASNSAAMAKWVSDNCADYSGTRASLNTYSYGTRPIPVYVVDSTVPGCRFVKITAGGASATAAKVVSGMVPWPVFAKPASQGDKSIAIYDTGTGIMREWFFVSPVTTGEDGVVTEWKSTTGAYSVNRPGLRTLGVDNYTTQTREGTSAAVGMHNPLGFINNADMRRGVINHAVAFTCKDMHAGPSWPARAADGLSTHPDAPREGQWCRLPATFNPNTYVNPFTGRRLNRFERMVCDAFKRHGGTATDKNLAVFAFNAENSATEVYFTGQDPWAEGGEFANRYGTLSLSSFPWEALEWAPVDWGRPSPDFQTRPGWTDPWVSP